MGITQELAGYCHQVRFRDLHEETIDRVKYGFLDFLSVAFRGSIEKSSQSMIWFVRGLGANPKGGVIIGTRERAFFLHAALANGTSSHAIELDDVNNASSLHPGVVIFPAALAMGEMTRRNGRRFIESVVIGYEVTVRLGKALGPQSTYKRGFHPTAVNGVFGSAVATAKMLALPVEKIVFAMGIAGSQAAGSMEYLAQGAWTKRFHAGWAAHSGMIAGLLARQGFWGPTSIVEGRDGFLHAYSEGADAHRVLDGLGRGFEIQRVSVKPHACCRYMQPPIDGVLNIILENNIPPEQVEKVTLGILPASAGLIAEPQEIKYNPQNVVDAQFSMPFGAAVAVLYRKAGVDQFQPSVIQSEEMRQMMKRVELVVDPELAKVYPQQWCATAEILTRDGKKYFKTIESPQGDPENPLSWDEMIARFHELTGRIIPKDQRGKIIEQIRRLEKIDDLKNWSSALLKKG